MASIHAGRPDRKVEKAKSTAGMRNADKARAKPYAMTRHKKVTDRVKAGSKFVSKAISKKQHRGHYHKSKKKKGFGRN